MSVGETARLLASLDMKDGLTPVVKTMSGSLDKLDTRLGRTATRAGRIGAGVGTALRVGAVAAVGALGGLAALSISLAKDGQEAQNVQIKYAQAIQNSGKVSADYVTKLDAQQKALENLGGVDDEAIKAAQTQLIQMGLTGDQVERLTGLSLDLSKATGKDLNTSTLAVGKAFQGNNRALLQLGIVVPKGADAIAILNQRFGGTTRALSGQLDTRLAVLHQRLQDVREEAGIKLLPAMTKIVDIVGQRLVPAFGKFIDAILPTVLTGLDKLGGFLEGGGAEAGISKFLDIAKTAAPIIRQAAEDTLTVVQTAVGLFSSLPPEIQALAVAGLTVNKLTGGLVTNLAGGLISAVISSFKGLMNVNAAVVNVTGPVSGLGGGGPLGGEPGNKLSGFGRLLDAAAKIALVGFAAEAAQQVHEFIKAGPDIPASQLSWPWGPKNTPTLLPEIFGGNGFLGGTPNNAPSSPTPGNHGITDLQAQAEAARKHGVSDSNNAALKALQAIVHNTAAVVPAGPTFPAGTDLHTPGLFRRSLEEGRNPTRKELRTQIGQLKVAQKAATAKNALDISRKVASLQNRLDNRIATTTRAAIAKADVAQRAIVAAIVKNGDQNITPIINVPVTTQTVINGRLVTANFSRYTSVIGGRVVNATGGSGV